MNSYDSLSRGFLALKFALAKDDYAILQINRVPAQVGDVLQPCTACVAEQNGSFPIGAACNRYKAGDLRGREDGVLGESVVILLGLDSRDRSDAP
jgi:hypothetical protein